MSDDGKFHGKPCKTCGGTLRYKCNMACVPCKRKSTRRSYRISKPAKVILRKVRARATMLGLDFDLTLPFIESLLSHPWCAYCGRDIVTRIGRSARGGVSADSFSLDRVNPTVGYVQSNVVAACGVCQVAKGGMSIEQARTFLTAMEERARVQRREA